MKALIVGGGIIGSSIAWRLAAEGVDVTVFERGRVGMEASWAAAGMIAPQGEAEEPGVFFDLCLEGKRVFDSIVGGLIRESGIDPEYDEAGLLYVAFDKRGLGELERRARWQREGGAVVEELTGHDALRLEPALSPRVVYALYMPTNRRVDNRKLTQAYVRAAVRAGASFEEGASVDSIVKAGDASASGLRLDNGTVHRGDVIVNAAGSWASAIRGLEPDGIRLRPVRGQILCFNAHPGALNFSLFSAGGILVPRRDGRLLAGSVFEEAGYDKNVTMGAMEHILRAAVAMVPSLGAIPFREAWAGLRPATDDLLPVIGPSPTVPNVFYAAGHFRSGILLSALTGKVVADLVKGRDPGLDLTPLSPARFLGGQPVQKRSFKREWPK